MFENCKDIRRAQPLKINAWNFDDYVLTSDLPAMVGFGADWDIDSIWMHNALQWFAHRFDGKMIVAYANIDYVPTLFYRYEIFDMPTVIIFEDGKEFSRLVGYKYHGQLDEMVDKFFGYLPYDRENKIV